MAFTSSFGALTDLASIWSPMANFSSSLPLFSWSSAVTALTETTISDISDRCTETVGQPLCAFQDATNYVSEFLYGKKPAPLPPKVVTPTMNSTTIFGIFVAIWATYLLTPLQYYQTKFMKYIFSPIASFVEGRIFKFLMIVNSLHSRMSPKPPSKELRRELEHIKEMIENLQNGMTQLFDTALPMQEDINNTFYDAKEDMERDIELGKRIVARHHDTIAQVVLEIFRIRARMNPTNAGNSARPSTQQQQPAFSKPQFQLDLVRHEGD